MHKQTLESPLAKNIAEKLEGQYLEMTDQLGDLTILIPKDKNHGVLQILKDDPVFKFEQMMDLTAVDYLMENRPYRFQIVYHLFSLSFHHRLRIKCCLNESDDVIMSIHDLWKSANWYERECFDMFGIRFTGHPDLRRIIMYDEFEGHPLRKDYPITLEQPRVELKDIPERYNYMDKYKF